MDRHYCPFNSPRVSLLLCSQSFISSLERTEYIESVNITLSKDYLAILGSFMGLSRKGEDPRQMIKGYVVPGKKFIGGDHIINRIRWDKAYDQSEFTVGYEDRFMGLMEMPFNDFVKSEVPLHRIKFFKKKGYLMWDRTKRIDRF